MEDDEKPGFMDKAISSAMKTMGMPKLPVCEVCGGHLAGGSMTIRHKDASLVICMKCVFDGIEYWLTQRDRMLKAK
jgi:ribosome-binding protein aMBF1 (putative translation factor)